MAISPSQAEAMFEILVNDLDVNPDNHDVFMHACLQGAREIQVNGFTQGPKRKQARLLLLSSDPRVLRCHKTDDRKLEREQRARLHEARWRLSEVAAAPPILRYTGGPQRLRVSPLAA